MALSYTPPKMKNGINFWGWHSVFIVIPLWRLKSHWYPDEESFDPLYGRRRLKVRFGLFRGKLRWERYAVPCGPATQISELYPNQYNDHVPVVTDIFPCGNKKVYDWKKMIGKVRDWRDDFRGKK